MLLIRHGNETNLSKTTVDSIVLHDVDNQKYEQMIEQRLMVQCADLSYFLICQAPRRAAHGKKPCSNRNRSKTFVISSE